MRRYHQSLECEHMPARRRAFDVCGAVQVRHIIDEDRGLVYSRSNAHGHHRANTMKKEGWTRAVRPAGRIYRSEARMKPDMVAVARTYTTIDAV